MLISSVCFVYSEVGTIQSSRGQECAEKVISAERDIHGCDIHSKGNGIAILRRLGIGPNQERHEILALRHDIGDDCSLPIGTMPHHCFGIYIIRQQDTILYSFTDIGRSDTNTVNHILALYLIGTVGADIGSCNCPTDLPELEMAKHGCQGTIQQSGMKESIAQARQDAEYLILSQTSENGCDNDKFHQEIS